MKTIIVAALLVSCAAAGSHRLEAQFADFKARNKKTYESAAEEERRFAVFAMNMKKAAALKRANPLADFGANQFSDMTAAEFKTYHKGEKYFAANAKTANPIAINEAAACTKIDWRTTYGAVMPVKDQGQCGSCWAFAAVGNIEGQWFLGAHRPPISLSEQELVSCDTNDSGCDGGLMDNAFKWLVDNRSGAIVTEASLPYVSGSGSVPACPANLDSLRVGAIITGHRDLPHDEGKMAAWMCTGGPIAIAVDASSWQSYISGIMTNCISSQLDHGVLAVGFDDTYSTPYWIIKNSWGVMWGESGYIRIEKGTKQCMINSYPTTAIASGPFPPPSPTTTTATPAGGSLIQMDCDDDACSQDCSNNTFTLNTCLPLSGGGSATAACTPTEVTLTIYTSTDCIGSGQKSQMPLNQCLQSESGYFENFCVNNHVPARQHFLQRLKRIN